MATNEIAICSAALVRVGVDPITTLEGGAAPNVACRTLYPSVVRDRLSGYRWRFAMKEVLLERTADVVLGSYNNYSGIYQLPLNTETVWRVSIADTAVEYNVFGSVVHLDAGVSDTVLAEVGILPAISQWPGYFSTLIELDLAAALAVPLTEDTQKASYYEGKALRQYAQARHLDSSTHSARKIEMGGLRRLHGGRP